MTEAVHRPTYCYVALSACYSGEDLESGLELFHEQTVMPKKHQLSLGLEDCMANLLLCRAERVLFRSRPSK
jgi:hypothetical protein